ncbi:hypothetical protein NE865_03041 [Phthorimaea operculella]|nr:hypothetical protein NE865_03041 [Phthorimaea operculella]
MLKVLTVILVLVACCYCSEDVNEVVIGDARAAKKRKNMLRLWALVLFFVFSKVMIFKVASFMFFFMLFQKLFTFAGIMLSYYMKPNTGKPVPSPTYGPPGPTNQEYNTLGYSYGPPDQGNPNGETGPYPAPYPAAADFVLPGLADVGNSFSNWFHSKSP